MTAKVSLTVAGATADQANVAGDEPTVRLRDAVSLGQRVRGTSSSSCYVVVALASCYVFGAAGGHGLVGGGGVAARWKGDQLSVRIEGVAFAPEPIRTGLCTGHGFTDHHGGHLSRHVSPIADAIAFKQALGAILWGLSVAVPTLEIIHPAHVALQGPSLGS